MEDCWKEGQEVEAIRIIKKWRLSKRDAEEMNEGENPLYPWQVDRFRAADSRSVRQQERDEIVTWLRGLVSGERGTVSSEGARLMLSHIASAIENEEYRDPK